MSFDKAHQNHIDRAVIDIYQKANIKFRQACSVYTKIRNTTDHPRATDEDILAGAKALKNYRAACKEFHAARNDFLHIIRASKIVELPHLTDEEYVKLYGSTTLQDSIEIERREIYASDPAMKALAEKLLEKRRKEQEEKELKDLDDPTMGFDIPVLKTTETKEQP